MENKILMGIAEGGSCDLLYVKILLWPERVLCWKEMYQVVERSPMDKEPLWRCEYSHRMEDHILFQKHEKLNLNWIYETPLE